MHPSSSLLRGQALAPRPAGVRGCVPLPCRPAQARPESWASPVTRVRRPARPAASFRGDSNSSTPSSISSLPAALDAIQRLEAENARLRSLLGEVGGDAGDGVEADGDAAAAAAATPPSQAAALVSPPPPAAATTTPRRASPPAAPAGTGFKVAAKVPAAATAPAQSPAPPTLSPAAIAWPAPGGEPSFWDRPPRSDGGLAAAATPPPPPPPRSTAHSLSIVHIAAELAPRAKVGGLGDVVAGLTLASAALGHDPIVCLPFYECLPDEAVTNLTLVDEFDVPRGWNERAKAPTSSLRVSVFTGSLDGVPVALFRPDWNASPLFKGARIYGGSHSETEAYLFFCRASLDWLARSVASGARPPPDALHVHDWQCAPAAMLYWQHYAATLNPSASVVLTIHNFDSVGECRVDEFRSATGWPSSTFATIDRALDERTIGHNPERLCLMKGGIVYANAGVVTVSPTYASEAAEGGAAGFLRSTLLRPDVRRRFRGVLNGIDISLWDPSRDAFLPLPYTAATAAEGKAAAKRFLQLGFGLEATPAAPLAVCITRLVPQKGVHLIRHSIHAMLGNGGQYVLLGTGHADGDFKALADGDLRESKSAKMCLFYSEALAHLLYAAADFVLVPSLFEPCGLTQLIALRYGAVPIVRATGGLADTVTDVDGENGKEKGNGFSFTGTDEGSLDGALHRALAMYRDRPAEWASLVSRNMGEDVGWAAAAAEYVELYEGALVKK